MTSAILAISSLTCGAVSAYGPTDKATTQPAVQQPVLLKFNFQPGDKYAFSSNTKQRIEQEMMGQKMVTTQDMESEYLYDIQRVENGTTIIKVTFSTIKMDMDIAGMQRIAFDSDNPEAATSELQALTNMVGRSFTMHVDAAGDVKKIVGLAEIIASAPGQQAEMLKQTFNDSSMVQSMSQFISIYPNRNVAVGDQWAKQFSGPIANMMQYEGNSTFSLAEIEGDLAIVETTGQMKFSKLEGPTANPMLQGAEFNLTGTQTGTCEIAVRSGLPVSTQLNQHITGDIDVQGFKIPMTIHSDMVITGRKL